MKNKYLLLFEELNNQLDLYHNETNNQRYLQIMLERQLKNMPKSEGDIYEPDAVTRKIIYAIDKKIKLDDVDSKEAQKLINIEKLQKYLANFVEQKMDSEMLIRVGYIPVIAKST